jgi:hypothetical protein
LEILSVWVDLAAIIFFQSFLNQIPDLLLVQVHLCLSDGPKGLEVHCSGTVLTRGDPADADLLTTRRSRGENDGLVENLVVRALVLSYTINRDSDVRLFDVVEESPKVGGRPISVVESVA